MKAALRALHALALGLWVGAVFAIAGGAVDLFAASKPVCPACGKGFEATSPDVIPAPPLPCEVCGANHHAACLTATGRFDARGAKTCGLGDGGTFAGPHAAPVGSGALFARVVVTPASGPPRHWWRCDRTTPALEARGVHQGDVVRIPYPAAGDAAARLFELARFLGIAFGIVALGTVFLTPPGGALRLFRLVAIVLALACAIYGASVAGSIVEQRDRLDAAPADEVQARLTALGGLHGRASGAGLAEAILAATALVLATAVRPAPPSP
jgi:hypothetical protein